MAPALRRLAPYALVGAVSAWIALAVGGTGDYAGDAGLPVYALAHGDFSTYLSIHGFVGPFAIALQAPFAALARGGQLAEYRWACFPCLLAVGFLGLYLAALARRRGASSLAQWLIAALCLVNPLTFEALRSGHPEEILTAALAVGAIALAAEGRESRAAVVLGLAIASKQWAVIAILPVLMALPARRLRAAAIAAAVAFVLFLPGLIAAPTAFVSTQGSAASTGHVVDPWNVWYPFAEVVTKTFGSGPDRLVAQVHEAPPLVGRLAHPLIVLLALAVPLGLALRRRRLGVSGADAMALFALLALLRCALDPVDNLYYHEPFLLALLGWDAIATRGLPLRGMVGAALALLFWRWSHNLGDPHLLNVAYIAVVASAAVAIAVSLFSRTGDLSGRGRSLQDRLHSSGGGTLASVIFSGRPHHFSTGPLEK
jgi:hypothetical protein